MIEIDDYEIILYIQFVYKRSMNKKHVLESIHRFV